MIKNLLLIELKNGDLGTKINVSNSQDLLYGADQELFITSREDVITQMITHIILTVLLESNFYLNVKNFLNSISELLVVKSVSVN